MSNRVTRRLQILSLCGLMILTAGIAAAPSRQMWVPLVGQQFGQWLDTKPAAAPTLSTATAAARAKEFPGPDLSTARTAARLPGVDAAADAISPDDSAEHGRSATSGRDERSGWDDDSGRTSVFAYGGRRTFVAGSSGGFAGGGGTVAAGDGAGATRPSSSGSTASTARSGTSNPPASPSPASGNGGGSSGEAPEPAAPPAPPAPPAAVDAPIGSGIPGLFTEHEAGLDHLTGTANEGRPVDGADVGAAGVAVNPEPSTLFLFGTGLAVAARALRRRMRR